MSRRNWLIVTAVVLLTVLPLWFAGAPAVESGGAPAGRFAGADARAQQAITAIAPDYRPWFTPVFVPASDEVASLLFALQAACGAGVIGYWLGVSKARERSAASGGGDGDGDARTDGSQERHAG
jgi:cobalt/nickel transport protein